MLEHLTTESRNPASEGLDGLTALEIVRLINAEDSKVAAAVAEEAASIATLLVMLGGRTIFL